MEFISSQCLSRTLANVTVDPIHDPKDEVG